VWRAATTNSDAQNGSTNEMEVFLRICCAAVFIQFSFVFTGFVPLKALRPMDHLFEVLQRGDDLKVRQRFLFYS
jgi:hypothetical protein